MKKEELISIIDDIQPDVHMKNRLKAKVIDGASKAKPKRITKPIIALCLVAIVVWGTGLVGKQPVTEAENSTESTTQNTVLDMIIRVFSPDSPPPGAGAGCLVNHAAAPITMRDVEKQTEKHTDQDDEYEMPSKEYS